MIENDSQLQQACEAIADLYRVLASYRQRVFPANQRNYAVLAEGPLEEIRKIQAEINTYLGLNELSTDDQVDINQTAEALREKPPGYG